MSLASGGRRTSAVSCPPGRPRRHWPGGSRQQVSRRLVQPGPRHARLRSRCVIEIPVTSEKSPTMRQGLRAARGRPGRAYHSVLRCDGAGSAGRPHRRQRGQRRRPARRAAHHPAVDWTSNAASHPHPRAFPHPPRGTGAAPVRRREGIHRRKPPGGPASRRRQAFYRPGPRQAGLRGGFIITSAHQGPFPAPQRDIRFTS